MLGGKPLWFTEVGWWSDGDYNYLNQANVVARAMIWQKVLGIPVWNYFFDEGNWGNDGVSFSLIQASDTDDYVKPAALATMATSSEIADRPYLSMPTTGIPQTYEASFGAASGGTRQGRRRVVGRAGHHRLGHGDGSGRRLGPGHGDLGVRERHLACRSPRAPPTACPSPTRSPTSPTRWATPSPSAPPRATAPTWPCRPPGPRPPPPPGTPLPPSTDCRSATTRAGARAPGTARPVLTVTLADQPTINRIVVDTQSVGSTATGVRNYTRLGRRAVGGWTTVATVVGQYRTHELQLAFAPVAATAVQDHASPRSTSAATTAGASRRGGPRTETGTAFVHALQVYAGTDPPAPIDGSDLTPLVRRRHIPTADDHHDHDHDDHDRRPIRRRTTTATVDHHHDPTTHRARAGRRTTITAAEGPDRWPRRLLADHQQRGHLRLRAASPSTDRRPEHRSTHPSWA